MAASSDRLADLVIPFLVKEGTIADGRGLDMVWLAKAVSTLKERAKTLVELAVSLKYYIADAVEYQDKAREKFLNDKSLPLLKDLKDALAALADFSHAGLEPVFKAVVEKHTSRATCWSCTSPWDSASTATTSPISTRR